MTTATLDLATFLEDRTDDILSEAAATLQRAAVPQYEAVGIDLATDRMRTLFDMLVQCTRRRDLEPIRVYGEHLGVARQRAGYDLAQVQAVINVLEETIWTTLTHQLPPEQLAYALGMVSTILGTAKDRLACAYVSSVSERDVKTLRLDSLFEGSESLFPNRDTLRDT